MQLGGSDLHGGEVAQLFLLDVTDVTQGKDIGEASDAQGVVNLE